MNNFNLILDPAAQRELGKLDGDTQKKIQKQLSAIRQNPAKGNHLTGSLAGLQSVYAAAKRFRIVYGVDLANGTVTVLSIGARQQGNRNDPYAKASRRL